MFHAPFFPADRGVVVAESQGAAEAAFAGALKYSKEWIKHG
jgi:hypothetical protein